MNDRQRDLRKMSGTVTDFNDENLTVISAVKAMVDSNTRVKLLNSKIDNDVQKQEQNITGITIDKEVFKNTLVDTIDSIISPACAYAKVVKNNELFKKFDLSFSDLKKMPDNKIINYSQTVFELLNPIIDDLVDYGLLPVDMTLLTNDKNNFEAVVNNPQIAIKLHKSATKHLEILCNSLREELNDIMDKVAVRFKVINIGFYQQYRNCRRITQTGTHVNMGLELILKESIGNTAVKNALATVPNTEVMTIETSDSKGKIFFHLTEIKTYNITIEHPDYITWTGSITLKEGIINKLTITLTKKS